MIIDGHLDLAYNVIAFRRNICHSLEYIRSMDTKDAPGTAVVSLQELKDADVRICFGTIFVAPVTPDADLAEYQVLYNTPQEAYEKGMAQLNYYNALANESPIKGECGKIKLIGNKKDLEYVLDDNNKPITGIVPLMEGADPIRNPSELEIWYNKGLRIIGPAWSNTRYAKCAWSNDDGFTPAGFSLMQNMSKMGMILDVSHLSEIAVDEALEHYEGPIIASHCNARAVCDSKRNLRDDQIKKLAQRGGIIGLVMYQGFIKSESKTSLNDLVKHASYIAGLIGNCDNIGIGSDLDGGFGREEAPLEIERYSDIERFEEFLKSANFTKDQVEKIKYRNWAEFLKRNLK